LSEQGYVVTGEPPAEGASRGGDGLGALLRERRVRALLTQEELAERAGLSVRTIRGLESGGGRRPRGDSLRRLADALDLSPAELNTLARGAPAAERMPPMAVPRQLPAVTAEFVGRGNELAALDIGPDPSAVVVTAIDGMAGVGKTALAVLAAHRWADEHPDGQLFLDLHGFTEGHAPVEPGEALDRMLRALEVPAGQIPANVEDRAALFRSRLAGRRVLVVLDNAADETQVAPLLPGTAGCLVIVTSRRRLTGLEATRAVSLEVLPPAEAVRLFTRAAGSGRLDAEPPDLLTQVVELCGRLPLALRVAAARLRSRPTWTVAYLVERLRDHQHRLTELDVGARSIAAALDLSAQQLTDEQRRAYRLLGLHPGADLDVHAAAALFDTDLPRARRLLDHLLDDHLLTEFVPRRYGFHDLTRSHAADLAAGEEPAADAALARLLAHYAHTATAAMDVAYPFEQERRPRIAPASTPAPALDDAGAATAWLDTELRNLLATARLARDAGFGQHALHLSATLNRHLGVRGRNSDAETLHELALAAATAAGDRAGEVLALTGLGLTHQRQGRFETAGDLCWRAVELARVTGDRSGEMEALIGLGIAQRMRARYDEAADEVHEAARRLAHALGHLPGEMEALIGLGDLRRMQGRFAEASQHLEASLAIATDLGHRTGERVSLSALGWVYLAEENYDRAAEMLERSLAGAYADGFRLGELTALSGLGAADRQRGRHTSAATRYRRMLAIADEIGDPNARYEALQGMGRVHQATGRHDEAIARHREAIDVAAELDQPHDVARAHDGLAYAQRSLGQHSQARHHWQAALDLLDRLGIDHTEDEEASTPAIRARLAELDR
jgi:tetratricopeptide (TPR) repeat protein/DNA-binding XRE family transcriptional regulator